MTLTHLTDIPLDAYQAGMPVLEIPAAELVVTADYDDECVVHIYRRTDLQEAA